MKKGFTLIELLVVIAIISILAALLFPVFAQAKAAAKQTVCMSNLKQIGTAFNLYMNDYDDVFPYAVDASDKFDPQIWSAFPDFEAQIPKMPLMSDALQPYLKSHEVFHCPSDTGLTVLDENFPQTLDGSYSCFKRFGSSYFFRTEIAFRALTSSSFKLPADVNVMFDGTGAWHGSTRLLEQTDTFAEFTDIVRGYRYNCIFGDFHAKSISYNQMQAAWAIPVN